MTNYKSIGCPNCNSQNTRTLNPYKDAFECGYQVECLDCGDFWDEPTQILDIDEGYLQPLD